MFFSKLNNFQKLNLQNKYINKKQITDSIWRSFEIYMKTYVQMILKALITIQKF